MDLKLSGARRRELQSSPGFNSLTEKILSRIEALIAEGTPEAEAIEKVLAESQDEVKTSFTEDD